MDNSAFGVRGVVEGFYGVYYTWPERDDLIRFIGQHGYNLYIYAPKDDWHHRLRWWQPYPPTLLRAFAASVAAADEVGVRFCYALHCSLPSDMSRDEAIAAIRAKLETMHDCGVRAFSLLFDDLDLSSGADPAELPQLSATLHAEICNGIAAWLQRLDPPCTLSMCPTEYHGALPFSRYLHTLGALLDPAIAMFYTGPAICSPTISLADVVGFTEAAGRAPLIWDNYPVNDLAMQPELHLDPIRGRDPELSRAVAGIVINPMLQPEASKIPLLTYAAYLADPQHYDPARAWTQALDSVAGAESVEALRHLASFTMISCLGSSPPEPVSGLVRELLRCWHDEQPGASREARHALGNAFEQLREDCYHLKYRLDNLRLRQNLLPWILTLEARLALARHALRILESREQGHGEDRARRQLAQAQTELGPQPQRVLAEALDDLVRFVQTLPGALHLDTAAAPRPSVSIGAPTVS